MLHLSLLLLALPLVMADVYYNGTLDSEWEIWKMTYHKQYNDKMHELMRRVIWEKNFQTIRAHNLEYAQGLHAYKLAMNKFGDMEQKCMYNVSSKAAEIKDFKEVQNGNEKALMEAVGSVGPVSVRISAVSLNFFFYDKGIYYEEDCDPDVLNLAVLIVGYGVDIEGKYWIVKNCWGEDWGEKGYILMAKDEGNHCGIANMASYPIM